MKKILAPCDFSKPAINAYRFALNTMAKLRDVVHLIYIVEMPVMHDTMLMPVLSVEQDVMDDLTEKAKKNFQKLVDKYKTRDVKIRTEVVFGTLTNTIIDYANAQNMDVIVMGSHGASGIKGFFVGSNTEKVVRTSPVPVFVLKEFYDDPIQRIVFPYAPELDDQKDLVAKVVDLQKFFKAHIDLLWINSPGDFLS